jgi:hypothetical protein
VIALLEADAAEGGWADTEGELAAVEAEGASNLRINCFFNRVQFGNHSLLFSGPGELWGQQLA